MSECHDYDEASSSESLWNPTLKDISERVRADALAVDLAKVVDENELLITRSINI